MSLDALPHPVNQALSGYKHFTLPNLSALRTPTSNTHHTTVSIALGCTEITVLVALARCLGAYCATDDVLLGWVNDGPERLVRVSWRDARSWEEVLRNVIVAEVPDEEVRRTLDLDDKHYPTVAIFSHRHFSTVDHPLVVSFRDDVLQLNTSTLHFHPSTASVLANQIQAVTEHILSHIEDSPRNLSFLPQSLQSIYDQPSDFQGYTHIPPASIVTEFIARHAHSTPTFPAVHFYPDLDPDISDARKQASEILTYAELHTSSNQFARYLLAQGLEVEDRVAVCLPRGLDFYVCMLGIMKAGGCYVPIDPELPVERQSYITEDSQARFVLSAASVASRLADAAQHSTEDINVACPENLAYLLYTSGTTGAPKGCLLTHQGLSEAILALSSFPNEAGTYDGRYLALASVAFDVHLSETFVSFALGMTLLTAPRSQLLEDLPRWIRNLGVTHVGIVPSLIEATMCAVEESPEGSLSGNDQGASKMKLRYIASGGEKMSDSILERWTDHPQVKLANFYGPTEVTIGCAARFMSHSTNKENIGTAFANCSAYVVDEDLKVVMRGAVGELLVAGPLVGRGYHGRPDLTSKAFVEWEGKWTYRTGDLVRMMPDSTLEIMGRIDTQIKLRGVRIESEGISNILRKAASTRPELKMSLDVSTVLARHPALQTDQLVSFIAWDPSVSITHRRSSKPQVLAAVPRGLLMTLKEACARELASYMRPAHIVPLDFLPMNQNGKTDNKVLISIFQTSTLDVLGNALIRDSGREQSTAVNRQMNATEEKLVEIIRSQTTAPREQLGASSHLFELGFDSIKLIRLTSQIRSCFNALSSPISLSDIMRTPTVEAIASLLEERQRASVPSFPSSSRASPVEAFAREWKAEAESVFGPDLVESVLPTFPVQDGILYRSSGSGGTLYVQHVVMRCHGDVSVENLKTAWQVTMVHHEILRTVFIFSEAIIQVVLRPGSCQLPWRERCVDPDIEPEFTSWFLENEAPKISLAVNEGIGTTPPFRLVLFSSGDTSFLTLSIHHSIYDGISLPLLLHDVERAYLGRPFEPSVPLVHVLDDIYSVDLEKARTLWQHVFKGFNWPQISHRLASGTRARQLSVHLDAGLPYLESLAASAHVTTQALLTSAFAVCLGKYLYHHSDVVFGVIRSGRSLADEGSNNAQAPLISVLPSRVDCSRKHDLLQTVQRDIGNLIDFEHVPLGKVQQWIQPGKPLFETLFSISLKENDKAELWDLIESTQPQPDYFLAVEIVLDQGSGAVVAHAAYTDEDISSEVVSRVLENLESTVHSLAQGTGYEISNSIDKEEPDQYEIYRRQSAHDEELVDEVNLKGHFNPEFEARLRDVIAQFLNLDYDQVQSTTSLLFLGVDSIKAMGLSRRLNAKGIRISAVELMRRPTIRHLANFCQSRPEASNTKEEEYGSSLLSRSRQSIAQSFDFDAAKLNVSDVIEVFPATVLQSGMLSQTISSGGRLYIHAFPFKLSERIDATLLKQAWKGAVNMFAVLRTSFHFLQDLGCWVQAIHSNEDFKWSETESSEQTGMHKCIADAINCADFSTEDAFKRPPVYFRLLHGDSSAGKSACLIVIMHHALYDGVSVPKLSEAVMSIYRGDQPAAVPQFHDLLPYFEYQQLLGTDFWIQRLKDYHDSRIPRAVSSQDHDGSHTGTLEIFLSLDQINSASRRCNVTPQCFGQAAWAKSLATLVLTRDVVFGHVVSGRNVHRAEDVIGLMLNSIPCRVRFLPDAKNLDLLQSIHHSNLEALRWQHASVRSIQKELGRSTIWDSIFLFQLWSEDPDEEHGLWQFDDSGHEEAKVQYAFSIELHQHRERLIIKAACHSEVMTADMLDNVLHRFHQFLIGILEQPEEYAVKDLPEVKTAHGSEIDPHETTRPQNRTSVCYPVDWDPKSAALRDILAAVSKVPIAQIALETPLVSLGVDSISAIQVASKCRRVGIIATAADILRCEVVSDLLFSLSSRADRSQTVLGPSSNVPLNEASEIFRRLDITETDDVESVKTVSSGMKWLIGVWQRSRRARFQHAFAFRLPSADFDSGKLQQAWHKLVVRHAILRSTFASSPGSTTARMVIFKDLPNDRGWTTQCLNNGGLDADIAVLEHMKRLVSQPLSTNRPPSRAVLLSTPEHRYLVLHLHHFQYDAWSLQLLLEDLARLYRGDAPLSNNNLEAFLDCLDFSSTGIEEQKNYWRNHLPSPFVSSFFPSLSSKAEQKKTARTIHTQTVAINDLPALRNRAAALSVSLNSVFLACWARVQARYTEDTSAIFGLWHLGRSGGLDDIDSLAVPCMNVLPIYVPDVSITAVEVASQIQAELKRRSPTVVQSSLEDIDEWVEGGGKPLCNVFINIVTDSLDETERPDKLFTFIKGPYYIPKTPADDENPSVSRLAVTDLIQDDLMIDIFVSSLEQTVGMSVECRSDMLGIEEARALVSKWAAEVKMTLED